ncbi:hypothetical protein Rsub_05885 [Raphidocelis subcapitata]|uniref:Sel1 repeat family protein n=1 Tax=Raphidocelis subcapitata TaxID=307507 RepID=A0A2V0NZV0_9CHLO|nr:hypothetical protein Rsub_05885 [Raphidocelis subcapitata]|eukprot:GBF93154.1 hypothetical protein Rsub_05885 [Raphidocelis subcapitata]
MLRVLAAGAAAGLALGGLAQRLLMRGDGGGEEEDEGRRDGGSECSGSGRDADGDGDGARARSGGAAPRWWRQWPRLGRAAAAALGVTAAVAALGLGVGRHVRRRRRAARRGKEGRIPLRDLVRFKERQWFIEELENSRDGDPNAMLRLAKMYLHGQGCAASVAMAQEWLRKARYQGAGASLEELFATDDPDPRGKLRRLIAAEERRRAARRAVGGSGSGGGGGGGGPGGAAVGTARAA